MQHDVAPYEFYHQIEKKKNLLLPIHYYLLLSKNTPFDSSSFGFKGSHTDIKDDSSSATQEHVFMNKVLTICSSIVFPMLISNTLPFSSLTKSS